MIDGVVVTGEILKGGAQNKTDVLSKYLIIKKKTGEVKKIEELVKNKEVNHLDGKQKIGVLK